MHETLQSQAMGLSAGTLATCTGLRSYADLDTIREAFIKWCDAQDNQREHIWQDVWPEFWAQWQAEPVGLFAQEQGQLF